MGPTVVAQRILFGPDVVMDFKEKSRYVDQRRISSQVGRVILSLQVLLGLVSQPKFESLLVSGRWT